MDLGILMLVGWAVLPLLAYGAGQVAVRVARRRLVTHLPVDAERRLEELRRQRDNGTVVVRGRMADALRLAESTAPASSLRTRQH